MYGIDISPPIVALARQSFRWRNLRLRGAISDVRMLPFRSCSFDAVYSMGTVEHFDDTDGARLAWHLDRRGVRLPLLVGGSPGSGRGAATGAGVFDLGLDWMTRRFLVLAVLLLVAYFAAAPAFYASSAIETAAGWVAASGGGLLAAAGVPILVEGPVLRTPDPAFIVTQECVVTPLIPVYLAAICASRLSRRTRGLALTALLVALGELSAHYGLDPHVALFRAWAIVAPLALVWLLRRPVPADGARGDQEWRAWRGSSGCSCASR